MVSPVNFVTNATVTTSETQSCMRPVVELEGMNLSTLTDVYLLNSCTHCIHCLCMSISNILAVNFAVAQYEAAVVLCPTVSLSLSVSRCKAN